jgi:hypothetical protein
MQLLEHRYRRRFSRELKYIFSFQESRIAKITNRINKKRH